MAVIMKTINHGTKKKLSLVLGSYWGQCQGGAELQAHYIELEALRQGWDTHYLFLSNGCKYENHTNTTLHPIIKNKIWSKLGNIKYPYAGYLLNILSVLKPDVIYQRSGIALTGIAAYYSQKNNCRFIFHAAQKEDVEPRHIPWQKFYLFPELKFVQYGIRKADIIITQTRFQSKRLSENYERTSLVIPNGHPVPDDCEKPDGKILILWIGTWKPVKQPEIFVKLAGELGLMEKIVVIMIGRTENYKKLVENAQKNKIEVLGELPIDKVNSLLAKAHILVNTSKNEGFSNTFIQAWMRRVPVVSLQVDPDDILQKNKMGYYCSGSFTKLVQKTKILIKDNAIRETMGANAREYAIKNYSLDNIKKLVTLMAD